MRKLIVKICGITRPDDAHLAVSLGATHIGLIFAESSPRKVMRDQALALSTAVAGQVKVVGVFQNQPGTTIEDTIRLLPLDAIQYHGDERPDEFTEALPAIKAITADYPQDRLQQIEQAASMLLFDRPKQAGPWSHNWPGPLLDFLAGQQPRLPFLVAGGIDPLNVASIIRAFSPYQSFAGIDVASGVEKEPGVKDEQKLRALFSALKEETGYAASR